MDCVISLRSKNFLVLILSLVLTSCLGQNSGQSDSSSSNETLDDGGRYLKSQFYIADLNGTEITKEDAANFNDVLVCERRSGFCQSVCINQIYYSTPYKRYSLLWSGYIYGGTCSVYVLGHNDSDAGKPLYKYYSGVYVQPNPPSVLGYCDGISVASPNAIGRYDFTENRVPSGDPTPDPWGRRLYYALDTMDLTGNPSGRTFVRSYEPVQDSNSVHLFSYMVGGLETTWQTVNGFACVRENQITDAAILNLQ